ncbi:Uncharacterised protein g4278 [Pycnogonum litorale]
MVATGDGLNCDVLHEESKLLVDEAASSTVVNTAEIELPRGFVRMRYLMAALCWFSLICSFFVKTNMSIAIVDMITGAGNANKQNFNWNSQLQGIILSSFFWGYAATQVPGGIIVSRYGTKIPLASGMAVNGLLAFLTPICTKNDGSTALICIRVAGGLLMGMTYPCYAVIFSKWSPQLERSRLIALTYSGMFFGPLISFVLGGQIVQNYGWESMFYFTGSVIIVWLVLWIIFASDVPEDNPFASQKEIKYITENRGNVRPYVSIKEIPWKTLVTSLPFIAVVVAYFCNCWGIYTWMTELPTYMKRVYQVNIKENGVVSGIPYIVQALTLITCGHLSDIVIEKSIASTKLVRKLCLCLGCAFQALFLVLAANSNTATTAVIFLSFVAGFCGVAMAGYDPNVLDIAPNNAGLVAGIANSFGSLAGIFSPLITGMVVVDQSSAEEWKIVFYISASLLVSCALVFGLFSSGTVEIE